MYRTSLILSFCAVVNGIDPLNWVNPLIGSQGGGNVFSGATLPYGMAKGNVNVPRTYFD